jgi:uncharacterized repeat protein (TIGR01451 family)
MLSPRNNLRQQWLSWGSKRGRQARKARPVRLTIEQLEDRTTPTVNLNSAFQGLNFSQSNGGYVPPDTQAAAGPNNIVETVNQTVAIYTRGGSQTTSDSFSHFWYTTGGLAKTDSGSFLSDPVVTYDDHVGRFIIGDQDVDSNTLISNFDIAVSKTNNPQSLTKADWNFYQVNTTEANEDADYPGNMGFNGGALVVTFNMFLFAASTDHVRIQTVNLSDLVNGVPQSSLRTYHTDVGSGGSDFSLRPTAMHDSANTTDPMWFTEETGDKAHITVLRMANVLQNNSPVTRTNLAVTPYTSFNLPLQPNGTAITNNIDGRIQKAAENGNLMVVAHSVGVSSTEDDVQWYEINVSGTTPSMVQQGRVSNGNHTYNTYPAIDINTSGDIGLTYMFSGTGAGQFMSTVVTGQFHTDAAGTMETPVVAKAGVTNYSDFTGSGRAGDLAAINVDSDGSFWAANEWATSGTNNWGTAIAHFTIGTPTSADLGVTFTGPSAVTAGQTYTYTMTLTNNGPNDSMGVSLSDVLPTGLTLVTEGQTGGPDSFVNASTGNTAKFTLADMPVGNSDTFTVTASVGLGVANNSNITNSAGVTASTSDPNSSNNTASVTSSVTNPYSADLAVTLAGPGTVTAGNTYTYTITLTNNGPTDALGVTLTDAMPSGLTLISEAQATGPDSFTNASSGSTAKFTLGDMPSGNTDTFTVVAKVASNQGNGTTITNTAKVTETTPDPVSTNNSSSVTSNVVNNSGSADLAVSTQGPSTVTRGQTYTFTITAKNKGTTAATSAVMTDLLPTGMTFVSASEHSGNDVWTNTTTGGQPSFTLANFPVSHTDTFWVVVSIPTSDGSGVKLTQTASITSATPDPVSSNNTFNKVSTTV